MRPVAIRPLMMVTMRRRDLGIQWVSASRTRAREVGLNIIVELYYEEMACRAKLKLTKCRRYKTGNDMNE